MRTHYYKIKTKNNQKMPTVFHSFLYDQLPTDQLFTAEDVRKKIYWMTVTQPYTLADSLNRSLWNKLDSIVEKTLVQLVEDGMGVQEIHWNKLEKLIKAK